MRSLAIIGILLLSGCASKGGIVTLDSPLCPGNQPDASLKAVRIEIDAVTRKAVNPKTCYVYSDTTVGWFEATGKPFDAKFKAKSPEKWGKMKWDSKPVGSHQEAEFKAKQVDAREAFEYDVTSNGVNLDPTVIIDPNKQNK